VKVAGLSLREIASRHGVSHVTIKKYLMAKASSATAKKAAQPRTKKRTKSTKHIELVTPPDLPVPAR
jgi:transposase